MDKLTVLLLIISLLLGCSRKTIKPRPLTNSDCLQCIMQLIKSNDSLKIEIRKNK